MRCLLRSARSNPAVCSGVALAFPAPRRAMRSRRSILHLQRPEARSTLAATLGPGPWKDPPISRRTSAHESDARVKLALAFALVVMACLELLTSLTAAVASCAPSTCALPAAPSSAAPGGAADLDQASFVRIVADSRHESVESAARFSPRPCCTTWGTRNAGPASIEASSSPAARRWTQAVEIVMAAIEDAPAFPGRRWWSA